MKGKLSCRCGCGAASIAPGFLEAIAAIEAEVGYELTAVSVCRCEAHNAAEGGKEKSEHLATPAHACCAVDVANPPGGWEARVRLVHVAQAHGFKGFGYANTFTHMDCGKKRFWFYPAFLEKHPALSPWADPAG